MCACDGGTYRGGARVWAGERQRRLPRRSARHGDSERAAAACFCVQLTVICILPFITPHIAVFFFWEYLFMQFFYTHFPRRSELGRPLRMPDANPPRQWGLAIRPRFLTHPRIRGLCHWAGEPAGRHGAESPSRRAAEHASERKSSSPRLHTPTPRTIPDAPRTCGVPTPPCSPPLLARSLTRLAICSGQSHQGL